MMRQDLRILVVDDNPQIRRIMRRSLQGNEVVEAENGLSAINILRDDPSFDVILSDMEMDTMNGREFFVALQEFDQSLAKRVVFVTGSTYQDQLDFIRRSLCPLLRKPFRKDELDYAIGVIVGAG